MTAAAVEALISQGRLERVSADRQVALARLAEAERHLVSATRLMDDDLIGAYVLLYDAARKAIDAHMLANGLRAVNRVGAHEAVARYAEAVFARSRHRDAVARFDRMRRTRNRAEYGAWHVGSTVVVADLAHAHEILEAVKAKLRV